MVPDCSHADKHKRLAFVRLGALGDVQILDGIDLGRIETFHASL